MLNTVSQNLARIAGLKCLELPKESYSIWYNQIVNDLNDKKIVNVQRGFDKLLQERVFGGLDYAVFLEGAKMTTREKIEKNNKLAEDIINE